MNEPLSPLSESAEALFAAERPGTDVPSATADRIWQQLGIAMPQVLAPAAAQANGQALRAPGKLARAYALKHLVLIGGGLLGVGIGIGAAVTLAVRPSAPPVVSIPALAVPPPAQPTAPPAPSVPNVAPPISATPLPATHEPTHVRGPDRSARPAAPETKAPEPPTSDADLAAERSLISRARSGLQHAEPTEALAALDAHAARFPNGRLAEEREALRVQALVVSGDREAAARAASAFERKYPQSLMGPAVRAALGRSP